jgi:hypothetical protein
MVLLLKGIIQLKIIASKWENILKYGKNLKYINN